MQMKLLGITNVDFDVIDQNGLNFLYPANTGEKLGVQWYIISAIHRFKGSLQFS
jgi:lysozyme family protein